MSKTDAIQSDYAVHNVIHSKDMSSWIWSLLKRYTWDRQLKVAQHFLHFLILFLIVLNELDMGACAGFNTMGSPKKPFPFPSPFW